MTDSAQLATGELRLRKLRWLCRRGMKELDVLLQAFTDRHAAALQKGEWPEFEALLQFEDDRLWDGLLNPVQNAGGRFHSILLDISNGSAKAH